MSKLKSLEEFKAFQQEAAAKLAKQTNKVLVCSGTGCMAAGAKAVYDKFVEVLSKSDVPFSVSWEDEKDGAFNLKKCGCMGCCSLGPLVRIDPLDVYYVHVTAADVEEIVNKTIKNGEVVARLVEYEDGVQYPHLTKDYPFYKKQSRYLMEHCGNISSESIEEYVAVGGYDGFIKALFEMTPEEVVNEVDASNLKGRGGAGFPAGKKWSQVAAHNEEVKYVVCNADEGDPGAFMDCSVMEGDPHRMIEGMMIAARAVGSNRGFIYCRAEYPLAVERLTKAIEADKALGLLGDNILGTDFSFELTISKGAGAFVCGEGSALLKSIEGNRGQPRPKLHRTVDKGLFEAPTLLNNVESYANIPMIITKGAKWYTGIGTEGSTGTKTFSLTGAINRTGLIEVPFGTTLREIVYDIGGGLKNGGEFKSVQIGGPSGGCLTKDHLDLPLDFDSVKKVGAIIGSGGLVVMGQDSCMVEIARFFMNFCREESCGKCSACREGVPQIQEILERITKGEGKEEDLDLMAEIADTVKNCSLCGLGKTATNPVMSTMRYFRDEYLAHVNDKKCPAGVCKSLFSYWVNPDKCIGCTKCARNCPVDAISGAVRQPHTIDTSKCIKCGTCVAGCPQNAIEEV